MVVYGEDGMDEISASAPTKVCEVMDGEFKSYEITPEQFSLTRCTKEELTGGTGEENAEITKAVLNGEKVEEEPLLSLMRELHCMLQESRVNRIRYKTGGRINR